MGIAEVLLKSGQKTSAERLQRSGFGVRIQTSEQPFMPESPRGKAAPGQAVALHFDGRAARRLPCGARAHGRIAELALFASLSTLGQPR